MQTAKDKGSAWREKHEQIMGRRWYEGPECENEDQDLKLVVNSVQAQIGKKKIITEENYLGKENGECEVSSLNCISIMFISTHKHKNIKLTDFC